MPLTKIRYLISAAFPVVVAAIVLFEGCAGPKTEIKESPEDVKKVIEPTTEQEVEAALITANQLASEGKMDEAAAILEELVLSHPRNIEALKLLAKVHSSLGNKERSSRIWLKIHSLDPTDHDAAYEAGLKMAREKDWPRLKSKMLELDRSGGADRRHYLLMGRADLKMGNKRSAERNLAKAGDFEMAKTLLGEIYYTQGKYFKAERVFKEALAKNPYNYSAHIHLGYISYKHENISSALSHYKKAVDIESDNAHAHLSLAAVQKELNNYSSAIEHFRKGLDLEGAPRIERKDAYGTLCRLLFQTGRSPEVYSVAKEGLNEFPESGALYFYWGMALLKDGLSSKAKDKFKKAAADPVWKKAALERFHSIR